MTSNAKIIEAATLMYKLGQIDSEGEELERAGREFNAALAQLEPADQAVMFMVGKLLEGKTFSVTAASPEDIRKYIAMAQQIGATVEDSEGNPWASALDGLPGADRPTSITIVLPSHPVQ